MKIIAWLAGIGTLLAGAIYMVVSLNRWEWNRALFFGLIVLIAEVGLATGLVLRRLARLEHNTKATSTRRSSQILSETRPSRDRFAWLRESTGQLERLHHLPRRRRRASSRAIAWIVDRVASKTSSPAGEQRLARQLDPISYPRAGCCSTTSPCSRRRCRAPTTPRSASCCAAAAARDEAHAGRVGARRRSGLAIGVAGVLALREATLSTHEPWSPVARSSSSCRASTKGGETGQTLAEMVEAQLLTCRLEVSSDLVGTDRAARRRPLPAVLDRRWTRRTAGSSEAASRTGSSTTSRSTSSNSPRSAEPPTHRSRHGCSKAS